MIRLDTLKWSTATDDDSRRYATTVLDFLGPKDKTGKGLCQFHFEALPVLDDDEGAQYSPDEDADSRLDALVVEYDAPGFQTVTLDDGKEYAVVMTPFGR